MANGSSRHLKKLRGRLRLHLNRASERDSEIVDPLSVGFSNKRAALSESFEMGTFVSTECFFSSDWRIDSNSRELSGPGRVSPQTGSENGFHKPAPLSYLHPCPGRAGVEESG